MRKLIFTLMFIPSLAFGETIVLDEPCKNDQGNAIANLKQCDVMIKEQGTDNVLATLTIPASSPTGCMRVSVSTSSVDSIIEGERSVQATCTTISGKVSAASNTVAHTFRGRATAAPTLQGVQD